MDKDLSHEQSPPASFFRRFMGPNERNVLRMAWPVLIELVLSSLFGMIDLMMLGRQADHSVAAASVAAVGVTNQLIFIGVSLVQALNVGGTAMIARYYGAEERQRMSPVLKHVLVLNLTLLTLPFVVVMQIFADDLFRFMGASETVITVGLNYFRILLLGFLFQSANLSFSAALRGIGETQTPMRINLVANAANVVGNAILIYGLGPFPALGATGAALSTALSQVFAFAMMVRMLSLPDRELRLFDGSGFRFDRHLIGNLLRLGLPASGEQLVMRVGILTFSRTVISLGDVVYAAHQSALSLLSLTFNPGQAFSIAASAMTGQALGARDPEEAKRRNKAAMCLGYTIAAVMALVFLFFAPQLLSLYSSNPEVIRHGAIALRIVALIQPFQAAQLILAGALRGAGDTFSPFIATAISLLLLRTTVAHVLVNMLGWGLPGAWIAIFVDQFVRWVIIYTRYHRGRWVRIKID
ncbi:MAG: MATE family efflux transporter [Bacillota bacterium]|nr:MATE family efflux transporter [Bacillota bacterium]